MKTIKTGIEYFFELPEGYEFKDENGNVINATKIVLEKKKPKYPKSYEECCNVKQPFEYGAVRAALLCKLERLLLARDVYWKIAGEEMGLDKPWNPIREKGYCTYAIIHHTSHIRKSRPCADSALLEFPTAEMRDAFYENFKDLIEECKELL